MINSQIVKILKKLTKQELRELEKFVQSPYFNNKPEVTLLYSSILNDLNGNATALQKENLFIQITNKNRAYDDALMRQWIHQLLKITKNYLIQKELESNETETSLLLAKSFRKRGMDDFFEKEIALAAETNIKQPFRHAEFHLKNYEIEIENIEFATLVRRSGEMKYNEAIKSLTNFFAIEMLRLNSVNFKTNEAPQILNEISLWIEKNFINSDILTQKEAQTLEKSDNSYQERSILELYYHVFQAIKTNDSQNFNALKSLLNDNITFLPNTESRVIFSLAINFCTKKINTGEKEFLQHFFDLNVLGLENRILFENGILSKFIYKNTVTVGLRLDKSNWVRQFLDDYKPFLHPKDRESVYAYNLATYYFRMKDFDNAQRLFSRADFGDPFTNIGAKAMLLKIYTETNAHDAIESFMDSFQVYVQRQKDLSYHQIDYLNFIKTVRKMRHNSIDKTKLAALREEVTTMKNIVEKDWLLEKLR